MLTILCFVSCIKEQRNDLIIKESKFITLNPNLKITNKRIISMLNDYIDSYKKNGMVSKGLIQNFFIVNMSERDINIILNGATVVTSPAYYFIADSNYYFLYFGNKYFRNDMDTLFTKDFLKIYKPKETYNLKEVNSQDLVFNFEFVVRNDTAYWLGFPKENPIYSVLSKENLLDSITNKLKQEKFKIK